MRPSHFPHDIDADKIAEATLAILSLTLHHDRRVWKGIDWTVMDMLYAKG